MSLDAAVPELIADKIVPLQKHARTFLDDNYDPSPAKEATRFCLECIEPSGTRLLEKLVSRDGHVLHQRGSEILPSVAFQGNPVKPPVAARSPEEDGAETGLAQVIPLPEGISHRVRNLFLLNLDLHGELDHWLNGPALQP